MSGNGMKKDKEPTKKQLKIAFQQQKAEAARMLGHLQKMGPLMEESLEAHFDILKFARKVRKDLDLVVTMDKENTDEVKKALDIICAGAVEFAAQHRAMQDPSWDPGGLALPKDEISDIVLDFDHDAPPPPAERSCTSCDWTGHAVECEASTSDFKDFLCCPICGSVTKEITEDPNGNQEDTSGENSIEMAEGSEGTDKEGSKAETPPKEI